MKSLGNWSMLIQCSDFLQEVLIDRNKKLTDRRTEFKNSLLSFLKMINGLVFEICLRNER